MKNKISIGLFLSAIFLFNYTSIKAQPPVLQVTKTIVVSGGMFEFSPPYADYVSLSVYDHETSSSHFFDTIYSQSAQDILMDSNSFYVAAGDSIIQYTHDLNRVNGTAFGAPSTIKLGIYRNYLMVGNWYGSSNNNLRIFNKNSLEFIDSIPDLLNGAKDFVIVGDTAYVQQNLTNSSFADSAGYLAVVDLKQLQFVRNITFNNAGEDLGRLYVKGDSIIGLNSGSNSISVYNIKNGNTNTSSVPGSINMAPYGQQGFKLKNTLYFKYNDGLHSINLNNFKIDTNQLLDSVTAFVIDTITRYYAVTSTDFASYTRARLYGSSLNPYDTIAVSFSPECIANIYGYYVGISESNEINDFKVYPIPFTDRLTLELSNDKLSNIQIINSLGSIVHSKRNLIGKQEIDLVQLQSGVYFIRIEGEHGISSQKLIKQ